jgi:hypothetical protein
VCVPAPPGVFLPVKRHRGSRDTHGTRGRTKAHGPHRRTSHNHPNPPTTRNPHVSATTEAAADSRAAGPESTAPRGRLRLFTGTGILYGMYTATHVSGTAVNTIQAKEHRWTSQTTSQTPSSPPNPPPPPRCTGARGQGEQVFLIASIRQYGIPTPPGVFESVPSVSRVCPVCVPCVSRLPPGPWMTT